jgi:four helix bundle protein
MDLLVLVYTQSRRFPQEEIYGLTNHIRRAAVSIPSNIAEGQGRSTTKDFLHMLFIARGSLLELQTQSEIACRLEYLNSEATDRIAQLANSVGRLLNALINALKRKL